MFDEKCCQARSEKSLAINIPWKVKRDGHIPERKQENWKWMFFVVMIEEERTCFQEHSHVSFVELNSVINLIVYNYKQSTWRIDVCPIENHKQYLFLTLNRKSWGTNEETKGTPVFYKGPTRYSIQRSVSLLTYFVSADFV